MIPVVPSRPRFARASFASLLLSSLGLLIAAPTLAQPPAQGSGSSFARIGTYVLLLDGERVDAEFYHSTAQGSILFESPELPDWVELQPRGRQVTLHSPEAMHTNVDGTVDRLPAPMARSGGTFELVDRLPKFTVDGRVVTLERKPDLLGPQTAESIMEDDSSYRVRRQGYTPTNTEFLDRLRAVTEPVRVKIFFGSWCSTCVELLPHVFRVQELIEGSALQFEYYGLTKDLGDPEARRFEVTSTPTGIVFSGEEEIGRIVGFSWRHPEVSLHNALAAAGKLTQ